MKHKQFKISDNTLFVYKSKRNPNNPTGTDPTTTMMGTTHTGIIVGYPAK